MDHIIPRKDGGKDTYKNLQLLHKTCHLEKTREEAAEAQSSKKPFKGSGLADRSRAMRQRAPQISQFNSALAETAEYLQEPDEVKVSRPDRKTRNVVNDIL